MKRALIISPYFPPTNTADMQRIRMSLPYFADFGWSVEVVTVRPEYSDLIKDVHLLESVPGNIKIHYVDALRKTWTRWLGFGNIAYRSLYFYRKYVGRLLKKEKFDLIYFSTTQFAVCTLGPYWKRKYHIPFIIDVQDMWHSEYYKDKPRHEQPPKYWFSYRLNRYLESLAMSDADGLISVSQNYLSILSKRYPLLQSRPSKTITFGFSETDFSIAANHTEIKPVFTPRVPEIHLTYVGRGGIDISESLNLLFKAFKDILSENKEAERLRFNFIGTSYAPAGTGKFTVRPVASNWNIEDYVYEMPDRIGFYEAIASLKDADALFIPGSNDPNYTASKIFPYLLARKPFFAIFDESSSAVRILNQVSNTEVLLLNEPEKTVLKLRELLSEILSGRLKRPEIYGAFKAYSSRELTHAQVEVFNKVTG